MSQQAVVLMTALPPTIGHQHLIDWAMNYQSVCGGGLVNVIVSTRSFEPLSGQRRLLALRDQFRDDSRVVFHHHADDNCPQNPSESETPEAFWNYWHNLVDSLVGVHNVARVFASETYGAAVARILDAEFIPVDVHRDILQVKATAVRARPDELFGHLMPTIRSHFRRTVTFFGGESCGKTTQARHFASALNGYFLHEWARPYLETVGEEITPEKMLTIQRGQMAAQISMNTLMDRPFVFQDTDLLTTIGYLRIFGMAVPDQLIRDFTATRSDLYVVMNSRIPFERDPLRYGGEVRQGNDAFWIALLEEFGCRYYVVKTTQMQVQQAEILGVILEDFHSHANMESFVRT